MTSAEIQPTCFDPLVVHPARLQILICLRNGYRAAHSLNTVEAASATPFVALRHQTGMTDGNLACHARKLAEGGLIQIEKLFEKGKPLTTLRLSAEGESAIARHVAALVEAVSPRQLGVENPLTTAADAADAEASPVKAELVSSDDEVDDWID